MAVGYTVIVKTEGIPVHPFAAGVTVMVATAGVRPVLVVTKAGIFPVPLAASPMGGVLLSMYRLYLLPALQM